MCTRPWCRFQTTTERPRSRTEQAWGCHAGLVLKTSWGTGPCRSKTRIVRRVSGFAPVFAPVTAWSLRHVLRSCSIRRAISTAALGSGWRRPRARAHGLSVHVTDPVALDRIPRSSGRTSRRRGPRDSRNPRRHDHLDLSPRRKDAGPADWAELAAPKSPDDEWNECDRECNEQRPSMRYDTASNTNGTARPRPNRVPPR